MTPEEQFRRAMSRAHHPGRGAAPAASAELVAELARVSEESRRRFTGGMQRVALPDIPLFPVPTTPDGRHLLVMTGETFPLAGHLHLFRVDLKP